ncbi:RagB/SusD family nutrient uptake outer membrane protein [Pedobacter heparinus]|uniref:RagB/SusD domain protein n=1 Tax=Pedobacter heparinus (strain ATCC 13125 / DSM 2366 / CIP 104194 / JCM 7457 / NBRC 12017 / NCIMB 9290 / NRRL B-14731 / HIM 762-3) TaxID=485917 RepID=C6XWK2_PEDHD|nr:RagB/SusD family nutrient uptake outer membrane protein [Pedobacter heparinus]ACU06291.1 RagB/SusD domain protein [Pedobacter heparinus DSM 2366]
MKYAIKRQWCLKVAILIVISGLSSCKKYLDIIPDNVATIDNAFAMRSEAEKYLYTCYSYMPKDGSLDQDPSILGGDEIWAIDRPPKPNFNHGIFEIAMGRQATVNPVGEFIWVNLYKGLRDCNIFLENVERVPDLKPEEKREWIAEVKFLKAYYHFYLVRMYGPIPLIKENLPVDVNISSVKITRAPVDSCFAYIKQLLDESKDVLQPTINDPVKMLGRITKPIVYSLKAKVMVTAASPLFNGNADQASLKNADGTQLFNQQVVPAKWDSAVVACKQAIDVCEAAGLKLYEFNAASSTFVLSDQMKLQLSLRNAFAEKWNSEIIWANTQSLSANIQLNATPNVNPLYQDNPFIGYELAPPLKIVDMFYTENGVPTTEDRTWNLNQPATRAGTVEDQRLIKLNYETSSVNFDREPRFYANLGFDGGIWYGQGYFNDAVPASTYYVMAKKGQQNGKGKPDYGSVTGYFIKKYVHYQNTQGSAMTDYSVNNYPWPLIRLSQLYLLYAEALNEKSGPVAEVHTYINKVRARAGLKSVKESWDLYANNTKYTTQAGMKDIIHRETLIELAFEGARFWDLRRWKEAPQEYIKPIQGWDIEQSTANLYYRRKLVFTPRFSMKDYFWPIRDNNILNNKNLIQNIGW